MSKNNKVAFLEPFPTAASPISIRDQGYIKPHPKPNILNLLSNLESKNRFMYKPADNTINAFRSPKNVRRLSLQIHQNFHQQEESESKSGNPERFVHPNFASFFNNSSPYTDRDDASRVNSSFFIDKSDCTSTTKNKLFEPKKLNHHVRRKSCFCTCCGGLSRKEKKIWHLNLKTERVARMDDLLSPSRQMSHHNPFASMSPPSRETTRNSNRSGRPGKKSVIDLRSSSPIKPKTAFGRRESMIAGPASPDFNIMNIETRTRNKTYTYERASLVPGVIEESHQGALERSVDLSMDTKQSSQKEKTQEDEPSNRKSIKKTERNNKTIKERGSLEFFSTEGSPRLEAKKARIKLTKLKNGSKSPKRSDKLGNKAAKILRSNSQLLLVQDYLGKGSLTERKMTPVKRIVHQNSMPRFSLANLEASSLTEAANKEIEELKASGILQVVDKQPSLTSLMDFSLRKLPTQIAEKDEQETQEEETQPKQSPKIRSKKRAMSLPKLLLKATGSQKKLQEVSKVYKSSREESDKRFGSVKIRLERLKQSSEKTLLGPGDMTNRTVVTQRECMDMKGTDSAYQRILKSLRSSLIEVTKDQKSSLEKKKSSAQKPDLERSQSIGYFPIHLFSKRKNIGGYSLEKNNFGF